MAQFSIPELGGSGQWMQGGMTMVGDMFDNALKARVDALCGELAQLLATTTVFPAAAADARGFTSINWWPAELGLPSAVGAQNTMRYAVFPSTRRLVIQLGGESRIFDTGEHHIGGVQQQQSGGAYGSVTFTSQLGTFDVSRLSELNTQQLAETPTAAPAPEVQPNPPARSARHAQAAAAAPEQLGDHAAVIAAIEALADLHQRGILSDDEFSAKKAELLDRL